MAKRWPPATWRSLLARVLHLASEARRFEAESGGPVARKLPAADGPPALHQRDDDGGQGADRVAAGVFDEAGDEDTDAAQLPQRDAQLKIAEHLGHPALDDIRQVGEAFACDLETADARYGDAAAAVDYQPQVGVDAAPQGQQDLVARRDNVVGRHQRADVLPQRIRQLRGEFGAERGTWVSGSTRVLHEAFELSWHIGCERRLAGPLAGGLAGSLWASVAATAHRPRCAQLPRCRWLSWRRRRSCPMLSGSWAGRPMWCPAQALERGAISMLVSTHAAIDIKIDRWCGRQGDFITVRRG